MTHLLQVPRRTPVRIRRLHYPDLDPSPVLLLTPLALPLPTAQPRLLDQIHKETRRQRRLLVPIQQPELARFLLEVVEDDPVGVPVERARQIPVP